MAALTSNPAWISRLCPLLLSIAGAVEVPGYEQRYPPLPGTQRGTPQSLVRDFEDVFGDEMIDALDAEWAEVDELARSSPGLRNSKRVTFWLGRDQKPRFAIERAVKLLEDFTFPAELGGSKAFGIVGCKYWVQRRGPTEDVNFHYDKDEGLASDQQIMRPPPLVGVTHMSNWGAPTIVLNQTTIHNGNVDAPAIPTSGFFVYPKRNKHCLHRGDLHHGAPHLHAAVPVPANERRITFITSWESDKPLEPNCHYVPDHDLPPRIKANMNSRDWMSFGSLSSALHGASFVFPAFTSQAYGRMGSLLMLAAAACTEVNAVDVDFKGGTQGPIKRRKFRLFLGEIAHTDMLANPVSGVTYLATWDGDGKVVPKVDSAGNGTGVGGSAFMGVFEMDLNDKSQMNKIFNQQTPALVIFYNGPKQHDRVQHLANRVAREQLTATAVGDHPPMDTFLANTDNTLDALKSFNLRKWDCPIAVMHYTKEDRKYIMDEEFGDFPFGVSTLRRFVKQVLAGKRTPNPRAKPRPKPTKTEKQEL